MALNPMLLYFAFELRMYSLLVLLSTASMYFLYTKQWKWYVIFTALGMYTQPFMAFVIFAQMVYLLLNKNLRQAVINGVCIFLLFIPWIPTLLTQFKTSGPMWMYPIDTITFTSVLGNVFLGYEGTPGNLWWVMQLFSIGFLGMVIWLWKQKRQRSHLLFFLTWIFVPLILVLLISLVKPIYVHRYVIYTTIGEVFVVSLFLVSFLGKRLQRFIFIGTSSTFIALNLWVTSFHHKLDLQKPFKQIIAQLQPEDVVYAKTPLVYYEALYYSPSTTPVYLYNPETITPPRYVGAIGMPPDKWARTYPQFPKRAFVISENAAYEVKSETPSASNHL